MVQTHKQVKLSSEIVHGTVVHGAVCSVTCVLQAVIKGLPADFLSLLGWSGPGAKGPDPSPPRVTGWCSVTAGTASCLRDVTIAIVN